MSSSRTALFVKTSNALEKEESCTFRVHEGPKAWAELIPFCFSSESVRESLLEFGNWVEAEPVPVSSDAFNSWEMTDARPGCVRYGGVEPGVAPEDTEAYGKRR